MSRAERGAPGLGGPGPLANAPAVSGSLPDDVLALCAVASLLLVLHFVMGGGYGFHRDELQFLSDARHLASGYVAYPPLTAWAGRVAIGLFGISPGVLRLPAALMNAATVVMAGLIAREMGGGRAAQLLAACALLPVTTVFSSVLQYNTPDLLAWTVMVFFVARTLRTGDERNWLGVGAAVGMGVLSKYSIAFPVVSLLVGLVVLPSQRRHLRSRWFYLGAVVALLVASPNLLWLGRHQFITITMERFIHQRDVRLGRAAGYWTDQLKYTLLALPVAVAGLVVLLRSARYRLLSVFFLGPMVLLALAKGRGYYLLPGYTVLYAAAAVGLERALLHRGREMRVAGRVAFAVVMALNTAAVGWAYLPVFPVGSAGWNWQMHNNNDMADEVGWPEFVAQVAAVRDRLPPGDRVRLGVLANNYGEAGALELYGPRYGLPAPISSTNSFHARGYGPFEPQTVIVVGSNLEDQSRNFEQCSVAGRVVLPYGVRTEETDEHPEILVCHQLRGSWPAAWARSQVFG